MKHEALALAIGDAVTDELKGLLGPLVASELARQRAGGDSHAPPALPVLTRSPSRYRLTTVVEWSATRRLNIFNDIVASLADALAMRVAELLRASLHAERVASGAVQRDFNEYKAQVQRIPAMRAAIRGRVEHLKNEPACAMELQARDAARGLVANLLAKHASRHRRAGRAA